MVGYVYSIRIWCMVAYHKHTVYMVHGDIHVYMVHGGICIIWCMVAYVYNIIIICI